MAVTPVGNPYVESSDLVANYPGASEALAERIDIVGVNPFANAAARDAAIPSPVQGQMCSLNDDNKGYRYDGSAWILFSGAGAANFTNTATGTYTDGGIDYKFLTFNGSDDLIVDRAGFADVLVIGGGGGGGDRQYGGGGGAGGFLSVANHYFAAGTFTVTVGAGGAGATGYSVSGRSRSGTASKVDSLYATFGGAGACIAANTAGAKDGGSGGGASGASAVGASGFGITGQGHDGGLNATATNYGNGGGGGAGAVGVNGTNTAGGAGGAGLASSITGSSVTRAGGGGGSTLSGGTAGAGGAGGGGAGNVSGAGSAGSTNTGGGGGGGSASSNGGAGGSGVVIVRVAI